MSETRQTDGVKAELEAKYAPAEESSFVENDQEELFSGYSSCYAHHTRYCGRVE